LAEEFLVLGQKVDSSIPKVKKCKKSVQNMLKTYSFLAKKCKKSQISDKKAPKNAHFYPHVYAKNKYVL
jgi:valyl-tRNA synthetase